jgi:hypothetical protein
MPEDTMEKLVVKYAIRNNYELNQLVQQSFQSHRKNSFQNQETTQIIVALSNTKSKIKGNKKRLSYHGEPFLFFHPQILAPSA